MKGAWGRAALVGRGNKGFGGGGLKGALLLVGGGQGGVVGLLGLFMGGEGLRGGVGFVGEGKRKGL